MIPPRALSTHVAALITTMGGPQKVSIRHDISEGHLRAVCEGRAMPGPRTLKAVGLRVAADGEIVSVR